MQEALERHTGTIHALAETNRRKILGLLAAGPKTRRAIVAAMAISEQATTKNIAQLKLAGLIHASRDNREVVYHLGRQALADLATDLMRLVAGPAPAPALYPATASAV